MHASRIPGKWEFGGVLLVPVELDDSVCRFLVDCGAAHSAINRRLLDRITAIPSAITVTLAPLGKDTVVASTVKIRRLRVGAKIQNDLLMPIVDFPNSFNLDGVLGMSFLHNYRFTIEPDTSTLVLREIPIRKK